MEPLQKVCCVSCRRVQAGFTLLEMLVVVALLAVIAGLGVAAYDTSADNDAIAAQLAQSEMTELAKALRQFRRDVGMYPHVPDPQLPTVPVFHPADFSQLFVFTDSIENSTELSGVDGLDDRAGYRLFNPDTGRGWRGPYLERRGIGCAAFSGAPNIADGLSAYAKMDPFRRNNQSTNLRWFEYNASNQCLSTNTVIDAQHGSPYLLLHMDRNVCIAEGLADGLDLTQATARANNPLFCHARIVSVGGDGVYGGANIDIDGIAPDLTDVCQPNRAVDAGKDDLVLCL